MYGEYKDDDGIFRGECDKDGIPDGKGTIEFSDGRFFQGIVHMKEASGRGVYEFPGGGRMMCGFTINMENPDWSYITARGTRYCGIVAYTEYVAAGTQSDICGIVCRISELAAESGRKYHITHGFFLPTTVNEAAVRRYYRKLVATES